ncbi:Solitary outer membrane autotransporter beta-barrel domain [Vibrio rumoiensis]|uniref:Solitary outer membrane autotransporter-like beta-barrel domain-containing protein n=1 Tax=Vibrio rumoiensis 1S-45 TaxID=1188252 RepID=A0A1E5E029_9VIBR|nr:Solitary outer membrane autotransporter beta-barrel domain [Vibrio rumoiensis]OEF23219.1 hypothetical protein A1QC_12675 [Vibrio rumoiensis 1S-45]
MTFLTTTIAVMLSWAICTLQAKAENSIQSRAEQSFAASVILSDSDVITFGIQDFNPNSVTPFDDDNFGNDESLDLRNRVSVTAIPYSFELESPSPLFQHELDFRASFIHFDNETRLSNRPDLPADYDTNKVYAGFVEYKLSYDISDTWKLVYGVGNHLMYYQNDHKYNSVESKQFEPVLDGNVYNTSSYSYIIEPNLAFEYKLNKDWGYWKYTTSFNYFNGVMWGESKNSGNPNGWYLMNGVKVNYDVINWGGYIPSVYGSVKRVDLGGDPIDSFGTDSYYELSIGWLLTPPIFRDYIDNVGIGLNMNYGSALKGGSIVFFFNEG